MIQKYYAGIGSRETPPEICSKMTWIAQSLYRFNWMLRSGGAPGADDAFEKGASDFKEIFLPWSGFNGRYVDGINYFLWDETHSTVAAKYHPTWKKLNPTGRAFHSRNVEQVLGRHMDTPVQFVVCWTSDGKASGGTGQAMRIAMDYNIPICNLYNESISEFFKRTDIQVN